MIRAVLVVAIALALFVGAETRTVSPDADRRRAHDAPDGGYLPIQPRVLASAAGVSPDVMTAARIIRSEAGTGIEAEQIAVVMVALTQSAHLLGHALGEGDLTTAVTRGKTGDGYYGAQDAPGRWISTRQEPTAADLALARRILTGEFSDNTGGARRFLHVASQDAAHARKPATNRPSAEVIAKWVGEGFEPRQVPGVSPGRFLVFVYHYGGLA